MQVSTHSASAGRRQGNQPNPNYLVQIMLAYITKLQYLKTSFLYLLSNKSTLFGNGIDSVRKVVFLLEMSSADTCLCVCECCKKCNQNANIVPLYY